MKTFADQSSTKDSSTINRQGIMHTAVKRSISAFKGNIKSIQRKPLCPCDGGCPRCKNGGMIQPKLTIGQPNDQYEQEADRVAEQVMRMPERPWVNDQSSFKIGGASIVQTKPIVEQISPLLQRKCSSCEDLDEEEPVQLKSSTGNLPPVTESLQSQIQSLRGGGQPLPQSTRAFFEPRFGADFSQVRVHTDAKAADAVKSINSKAFTTGKDVFFNAGQYSPGTAAGKILLGHELTHVVQQGKNLISPHLQALTEEEKKEDLESEKYSGNQRLQNAFDNNPPLKIGESGDAVRLVQEGLVADGFAMPRSTKPTGEMDGGFGEETFAVVKEFQAKHLLSMDGIVGRETMGKLDELALKGQIFPYCPDIDQDTSYSIPGSTNDQMLMHFGPNKAQGNGKGPCPKKPNNAYIEWDIRGNTAIAGTGKGTHLGRLAVLAGARGEDWKCIKPIKMKSFELFLNQSIPNKMDENYMKFVQEGDIFDISNLKLKDGPELFIHLFGLSGEQGESRTVAMKFYYNIVEPVDKVDKHIADIAQDGATPLKYFLIWGHHGASTIYGDLDDFKPEPEKAEKTRENFPAKYTQAKFSVFPRRCWFTKNATARAIGCTTIGFANLFTKTYLRIGSFILATKKDTVPVCSGGGIYREYPPGSCLHYDGICFYVEENNKKVCISHMFFDAQKFQAAFRYWERVEGKL